MSNQNNWEGNVERLDGYISTPVQLVELQGSERESFFQAVRASYTPAIDFKQGRVWTDGAWLYGTIVAVDENGQRMLNQEHDDLVTYPARVSIPHLIEDDRENTSGRRWIPGERPQPTYYYPNRRPQPAESKE